MTAPTPTPEDMKMARRFFGLPDDLPTILYCADTVEHSKSLARLIARVRAEERARLQRECEQAHLEAYLSARAEADRLRVDLIAAKTLENGKRVEQYYPGLADACRRAYRLTIDAMRDAAKSKGYALAVHGSLSRDIDLIAAPWTDDAAPAPELAEAIRAAAEKASPLKVAFEAGAPNPRKKPGGRLCWSFHLGGGPYIDLSVMRGGSCP